MLVDEAEVYVCAGKGGNGVVSFRREKYVPKGGPDGGDGGRGGDVILRARAELRTLVDFTSRRRFRAPNGKHGSGKNMSGAEGEDCVLAVPVGTVVRESREGPFLCDLDVDGKSVVVARGGSGGRGNARFATSTNRAPRRAEAGRAGEEKTLFLELKLIADVGLVGLPNAGKSSLLRNVSRARPRVAPYPFTTKTPVLGTVRVDELFSFVMVDIPGLIEGSHRNKGLGHRFLKHIERTRLIVFLIDASVPDPGSQLRQLTFELGSYSKKLAEKPSITVINKIDLFPQEEDMVRIQDQVQSPSHRISALTGEGVPELMGILKDKLVALARNQ